jgi:putative PIG3 family NAD(P)H quinone oxidoreductase
MQAVAIAGAGGPEVLRLEERPVPQPGPGEVLVAVSHAGVNRPDVLQRLGRYPPPPGVSDIPGLEIAGRIVVVGEEVPDDRLGEAVCALVTGGGYAQFCLAKQAHCLPVPGGLPLAEAAALPETLFTVWHNLFERGHVRDGETVLVHGGTSGIGSMAIKLGKLFDLGVIVTCGSDEKCAAALRLGADHAINYRTQDFAQEARALTGGRGVDCVLDMVAGEYTQRNLDCLAEDGRLVTIAVLGSARAEVNMAQLMVRRHTVTGSTLRSRPDVFKAALAREIAENVWPLVAEGALRPEIDGIFPLSEAAEAHRRMEAGDHVGKIVLETEHTA